MILRPYPEVRVLVQIEKGYITGVSLSPYSAFSLEIAGERSDLAREISQWFELYSRSCPPPASFPYCIKGSPFQRRVLSEIGKIPFGQTYSYKELAERCGNAKGARAVGSACGRNPFPFLIPCHRVIQKSGKLGGFTGNPHIKRKLLEFEGALQNATAARTQGPLEPL